MHACAAARAGRSHATPSRHSGVAYAIAVARCAPGVRLLQGPRLRVASPEQIMSSASFEEQVIAATRAWLEKAVIGLNLCPFAKAVHAGNRVRFRVGAARSANDLVVDLAAELQALQAADWQRVETTLLIHPQVLTDFLDYNDFLDLADATIEAPGLTDEVQVASFHPHYRFADSPADDIDNCTNRPSYPMLHLLRQSSVDRAVRAFPDAAALYEANVATLHGLGHEGWRRLWLDDPVDGADEAPV